MMKDEILKARSLVRKIETPKTLAAISLSRTATNSRPDRVATRRAANAVTARTIVSANR